MSTLNDLVAVTHFLLHNDVQGGVGEISISDTLVQWELTD
jgi:hypothetical protein